MMVIISPLPYFEERCFQFIGDKIPPMKIVYIPFEVVVGLPRIALTKESHETLCHGLSKGYTPVKMPIPKE
jgi:hypothetical protein